MAIIAVLMGSLLANLLPAICLQIATWYHPRMVTIDGIAKKGKIFSFTF
jgi:hypothetical protein